MSKQLTPQEMRERFLDQVRSDINYWANLPDKTPEERCSGVAHSILVLLDGCSMNFPSCLVVPLPHESDKEFHIEENTDYFPDIINIKDVMDNDIGGGLHDNLYKRRENG